MIMSKNTQTAINQTFATIPAGIQTNLQNVSVKLFGKSPKNSDFTGSGVILYAYQGTTYILTAKHNVYVFNERTDPPLWDNALLTRFQQNVRVYYDTAMVFRKTPEQSAPITAIAPMPTGSSSWSYDAMILESNDGNLAVFAANNRVPLILQKNLDFVYKQNQYLKTPDPKKNERIVFILTGFGKTSEKVKNQPNKTLPTDAQRGTNVGGALQYRITSPRANAMGPVFNELSGQKGQFTQFTDAIQLAADANDSTAEGDSGGPLFVYTNDGADRLYLIGVTTGSDMAAGLESCPKGGKLRENDIATSLEQCYRNEAVFQGLKSGQ